MDAFFAAVEERNKPRLKKLPIVVGSDPANGRGRGVVSTANYRARKYGIHSATPISIAWRLSQKAKKEGKPEVVFLGVNFADYEKVSLEIMEIIHKYSSLVEEASIDEAYFDLSYAGSYEAAEEIAKKIKKEIKRKEKLTASVGIGPNKLIAKIASDKNKPDGLTVIGSDNEERNIKLAEIFLKDLPIRKIPGIGPKTEKLFDKLGIRLVKDLKKFSKKELEKILGKWGGELYLKIRGRDDSPLVEEWTAKSIGEQETFSEDTLDPNFTVGRIIELSRGVFDRFKKSEFKNFGTIVITVRFSGFETKNRSHTLQNPINTSDDLQFEAVKMLMPFLDKRENPERKKIRLVGIRIEKLN